MPHDIALISTIAAGLGFSLLGGFIAARLRLSPIVGYLLAGVVVGPFTPGFVADMHLAQQLAEVGVILLMFGVGIYFSLNDLLAVRRIAVPGAILQIAVATLVGGAIALLWGWSFGAALVFGLALSVASTVVLLRALEQRSALDSPEGHIAIGWLIVEDLVTVVMLVLLPALAVPLGGHTVGGEAAGGSALSALALTLGKVVAFVLLMLLVGARILPWLLDQVARTGSRELFTLATLGVALGVAVASAELFGVSFALGAFFAGVVINASDHSHRAQHEAQPLQQAFGALFAPEGGHGPGGGHRRQVHGRLAHGTRLPAAAGHGADHLGEPRADRRILLHPGGPGGKPRPAATRRAGADRRRRADLHRRQPGGLHDGGEDHAALPAMMVRRIPCGMGVGRRCCPRGSESGSTS